MTPRKDRRFDWEEARKRRAAGETFSAIAESLGVTRYAIQRVVKLPASRVLALAQRWRNPLRRDQDYCPRCRGIKSKTSELCRGCRNETRLVPMHIKKVPSRQALLGKVAIGSVVCVDDSWGVVQRGNVVDFWEQGRHTIPPGKKVTVGETFTVHVGGKVQEPEEIEA